MGKDVRRSVSIEAKEHGISGQKMNWLLKTQGRMEGTPGRFRAKEGYKQYEHPIKNNYGYSYDSQFFEGIDYSESAMRRAEKASAKYKTERYEQPRSSEKMTEKATERTGQRKSLLKMILDFIQIIG